MTTPVVVDSRPSRIGIRLIFLAIVAFLLAAFGVTAKLGIDVVDVGLALFAAAFLPL